MRKLKQKHKLDLSKNVINKDNKNNLRYKLLNINLENITFSYNVNPVNLK